ncbi:hypothetical protein [Sporosarcina cascadiensis]|uniref:hypothetical protein n=1 Tax=Sporosarcina cascadiensis TaxID=2660747 RepID=UPI00129A0B82|nr:hypothetical protein [Sporosarcina cascadiensis]
MNLSDLSEAFGQEIQTLTEGTVYEIKTEEVDGPDIEMDADESRVRSVMYSLWMSAQSKKLAERMERRQAEHFEQLYEFSYGVPMYDTDEPVMKGTENLALMILDEKMAFTKRIDRLYEEHKLFLSIMDSLDKPSSKLLTRYFLHNEKVDYETLRRVLKRNLKRIEQFFKKIEQQQEEEVERLEDRYQLDQGRIPFMKGRLKVYMTAAEIQQYKDEQEKNRREMRERFNFF